MKQKKGGKAKKKKPSAAIPPGKQEDEVPRPFDFGGLPGRSLKKNLGCG